MGRQGQQVINGETMHLGNISSEAFGYISVLYNHKAWLRVAKVQEGSTDMKTGYDSQEEIVDKQSLANFLSSGNSTLQYPILSWQIT